MYKRNPLPILLLSASLGIASVTMATDSGHIDRLVMAKNIDVAAVSAEGEAVMPVLVQLYRETQDEPKRAKIAWLFYQLGWKSEEARQALMEDIHTGNAELRLQVQWALGRVSNSDEVVDVLLDNMRNDQNPLFRDKSACALAYDQIHLTPQQRYRLLQGLVYALNDEKLDVRRIALQALSILTGQTRSYQPNGSPEARQVGIARWEQWLQEYRQSL